MFCNHANLNSHLYTTIYCANECVFVQIDWNVMGHTVLRCLRNGYQGHNFVLEKNELLSAT